MDFAACLRGVLPISCSICWLCGASGATWPALRMGSVLFLGVVFLRMVTASWELAPSVTWEWRAGMPSGPRGSQTALEEVNSAALRAALQNGRFFSLALDVKFSSHSFLFLALYFCSVLHFTTTAAAETQLWFLWWFDESANLSQYQKKVSCWSF